MSKTKIEESTKEKEKPTPKKRTSFGKDELITIMNYTAGTVYYQNPRTLQEWKLEGFGATDTITYDELISMKSSQKGFLTSPWLLVMDDDAVEMLSLKSVYDRILQPHEIDKFYNKMSFGQMEKFIDNATDSMKELLVNLTIERMKSKELDSLGKIQLIESKLQKKLLD